MEQPKLIHEIGHYEESDEEDQNDVSRFRREAKARSKQAHTNAPGGRPVEGKTSCAWSNGKDESNATIVTENGLWIVNVEMFDSKFIPSNLVIPKGTTVQFVVSDEELSMIEYKVAVKCQDISPALQRGDVFKFSFCESGFFEAKDTEFKGMKCAIRVVDHERSDEMVQRVVDIRKKEKQKLLEEKLSDPRDESSSPVNSDIVNSSSFEVKTAWSSGGETELSQEREQAVQDSLRIYHQRRG